MINGTPYQDYYGRRKCNHQQLLVAFSARFFCPNHISFNFLNSIVVVRSTILRSKESIEVSGTDVMLVMPVMPFAAIDLVSSAELVKILMT